MESCLLASFSFPISEDVDLKKMYLGSSPSFVTEVLYQLHYKKVLKLQIYTNHANIS